MIMLEIQRCWWYDKELLMWCGTGGTLRNWCCKKELMLE